MNVESPKFPLETLLQKAPVRRFEESDARTILVELGLKEDSFRPELLRYMAHLGSHSGTMGDEERARLYTAFIAEAQEERPVSERLTEAEWRHVNRASTFTDIGKAGPFAEKIGSAQWVVTRLYAEQGKFMPTGSLEAFVREFFKDDDEIILAALPTVPGLSPEMTMCAFWDMHAQWSYDILKATGIPNDVTLSAAAHHVLEGENAIPKDNGVPIVSLETGRFQALNETRPLDMREVMVILIDKYEANMTRSGASHEGAIGWLRGFIDRNPVLARLPEWKTLFERGLVDLDRSRAGEQEKQGQMLAAK